MIGMKSVFAPLLLLLLIAGISSCSFQKRVHSRGFHIEGLGHKKIKRQKPVHKLAAKPKEPGKSTVLDSVVIDEPVFASASGKETEMPNGPVYSFHDLNKPKEEPCDVMVMRNGNEVQVKVLEVAQTSVRYKKCENLGGPDYLVDKSEVFMIKYANGSKDVMDEVPQKRSQVKPYERKAPYADTRTTPGIAFAAFVLSFGSIFLSVFGFFTLIAGLILGISALNKIEREPDLYKGRGLAIAAISFSTGILLLILIVIAALSGGI